MNIELKYQLRCGNVNKWNHGYPNEKYELIQKGNDDMDIIRVGNMIALGHWNDGTIPEEYIEIEMYACAHIPRFGDFEIVVDEDDAFTRRERIKDAQKYCQPIKLRISKNKLT